MFPVEPFQNVTEKGLGKVVPAPSHSTISLLKDLGLLKESEKMEPGARPRIA